MLDIPRDLNRRHPDEVTAWLRQVEDDDTVTAAEHERARHAATAALLGHSPTATTAAYTSTTTED